MTSPVAREREGQPPERGEKNPERRLSKTEQLIADLVAAGGVLRLERASAGAGYDQLVTSAQRFGKVPPGKRVRTRYAGGAFEIRLEDAPPGTEIELLPVSVPARVTRPHPAAKRFREMTAHLEVARASLGRCVRIVHALATEAERRGYSVANVEAVKNEYGHKKWSGADGHLAIRIRGHEYRLRISEEKVVARWRWEREAKWRASYPHGSDETRQPRTYDANATGHLTITLDSGFGREGRPASWADRKSWTLEDKLPDLLRELEIRAAEDDHRQLERERQADERHRQWELELERGKARFADAHRISILRAQVGAWHEHRAASEYLAALETRYGESPEAMQWISWIRDYLDRIDPMREAPALPETPEPSAGDLKPFLARGFSPYGPPTY